MWEGLIKYYDNLVADGKPVCPVAHTYISCNIGVLLDMQGNFLCAQIPEIQGELIPVPCTVQSGSRTSGASPHLLSDKLSYITKMKKYEKRHKAYVDQLQNYIAKVKDDLYASAVYNYIIKESVLDDLDKFISKFNKFPKENINIVFCVYDLQNEGIDLKWTEYYLSTLPKNGICCATGQRDYIPSSYPAGVLAPGGKERLFLDGYPVGYVASQKIIHAIQYMSFAKKNSERAEIEYNLKNYFRGDIDTDEFLAWAEKEYPGSSERLKDIFSVSD